MRYKAYTCPRLNIEYYCTYKDETSAWTDRQTYRQTDRQTDRQTVID